MESGIDVQTRFERQAHTQLIMIINILEELEASGGNIFLSNHNNNSSSSNNNNNKAAIAARQHGDNNLEVE
jgi:hypothetical protein